MVLVLPAVQDIVGRIEPAIEHRVYHQVVQQRLRKMVVADPVCIGVEGFAAFELHNGRLRLVVGVVTKHVQTPLQTVGFRIKRRLQETVLRGDALAAELLFYHFLQVYKMLLYALVYLAHLVVGKQAKG